MQQNMLKLNDSKTEVIVFGSRQKLKEMDKITVTIGDQDMLPKASVRIWEYIMTSCYILRATSSTCIAQSTSICRGSAK